MRLRRVVVSGFKTFASRTEVTFDRGITAVVGPNGSGKSNLVDAVRWALGETNARELRGQRMDEVIYAGGGRRPRVNLAEVELVIDNEEGRLVTEDPEAAVTRRVVRGAHDTEFRINRERARLRDLERLLGGTGLTQNGYAVVAQNDIDSIIEASPAQRRFEAAAAAGAAFVSRAQIERGRLDGARAARDAAAIRLEDSRLAVERAAGDTHRFADRLSGAVLQRAIAHAELEAARADLAA